jgi:hypothetical protein
MYFKINLLLILFFISIGSTSICLSQELPKDEKTGAFSYQEVVIIDGINSGELYSRAKAWIAETYRSANDVIQLDDKESGRLIVKGSFRITYYMNPAWVYHTLTLEVKDGRYRYTLTDFVFDNNQWAAPLEEEKKFLGNKKRLHRQVVNCANQSITALKNAMERATPATDDDW